jgi:hypothetical protein
VNKQFDTPLEKMMFEKRFGGLAIEKEAKNMVALASKLYTIWDDTKQTSKAKGCHQRFNHETYLDVLEHGKVVNGTNHSLRMKDGMMSHVSTSKRAISAIYTKYKVSSEGFACVPLFLDIDGI